MDSSATIQIAPLSVASIPLFIVGLLSTVYTAGHQEKTPAARFWTALFACFTLSMVAMFLTNSLVLWGGAFWPAQDAFVVACMAAVIGFLYHYPQAEVQRRAVETRLATGFGYGAALLALGYSAWYAYQVLRNHSFQIELDPNYPYFMGLVILITLGLAVRRTIVVHRAASASSDAAGERSGRADSALAAFLRPNKEARAHRNVVIALILGLTQGIASAFGVNGWLPSPYDVLIIGLALLALSVTLIYTSWNHLQRQPSLIVKLIGLSLVTLLAVLGSVGLFEVHAAAVQSDITRRLETEVAQRAIQTGSLEGLPESIVYIAASAPPAPRGIGDSRSSLIYLRGDVTDPHSLLAARQERPPEAGDRIWAPRTIWGYYIEWYLKATHSDKRLSLYFGSHPQGSYYQYAGYPFMVDGIWYEAGFSMEEINAAVHEAGLRMIVVISISSLFILVVFPIVFRANIIKPIDNLVRGLYQANAGDLTAYVPISQNDEIGYLTRSFNDMVVSIRTQIAARQEKEEALRNLTATLEKRVSQRTRELAVLYEVSAAASQAKDIETLLTQSLSQAMDALNTEMGAIILLETAQDSPSTPLVRLNAHRGLPDGWQPFDKLFPPDNILRRQIVQSREMVLINDLSADTRLPAVMRNLGPRSLLMAPMRADDQVIGILWLIHKPGGSFNTEDIALLASIADQIAVAVRSDLLRKHAVVLEERQRLAQDLHDSVTQLLYGLVTLAEAGQARLDTGMLGSAKPTFTRIAETARQALNEMRLFVHRLRPLDLEQQGLTATLRNRLAAVESWSGVRVRLIAGETLRYPSAVETALYQIIQEALNNALKHAHASTITVEIQEQEEHVVLQVSDNGRGFSPEIAGGRGLGLRHMEERASAINGALEIHSRPGEGTKVSVRLVKCW